MTIVNIIRDKPYIIIEIYGHTDPTYCHAISGLYCTFRAMVVNDRHTEILVDDAKEGNTSLVYRTKSRKLKTALEMFATGIALFHRENPNVIHITGNYISNDEFIK